MKQIIDISYANPNIDYDKVNVEGAILRIGRTGWGTKSIAKDSLFEQHYAGLKCKKGIYYYSCATTEEEAIKEAKATLKYLGDKKIDLPIYWDTEDSHNQAKISKEELTKVGLAYCNYIKERGYEVGIYASKNWLENNIDPTPFDYIWVAQYNSELTYQGRWDMWQYTSSGTIEGIEGRVDLNYMKEKEIMETNDVNTLLTQLETIIKNLEEENKKLKEEQTTKDNKVKELEDKIVKIENILSD